MYMIPYTRDFRNTMLDFFGDDMMHSFFSQEPQGFRVDVKDMGDHFEMKADLPGVKQEDIDISAKDDVMTISANFGTEEKTEQNGYTHIERRSGSLQRSFNMEGIDQNGISATYVDGVLTLNLPKQKETIPEVHHVAINGVAPKAIESGDTHVA